MKPTISSIRSSLKIAIAFASISLFLASCNRSPSDSPDRVSSENSTSQAIRENTTAQKPDNAKDTKKDEETETAETLNEDAEVIELPDFEGETELDSQDSPEDLETVETGEAELESEPDVETAEDTSESVEPEAPVISDESSIDVGSFDFQLRQAFVEREIVDRTSNKRLSADNAEEPSSYLFVELDLKNNSDEVMWDSVLYNLECGDGQVIDSAADVARVYRSNQNI
ncbi:MAG: hypothetical protein SWY16_14570, partial [Cyanobacteriota bacterium]|nr:hypothetical protein [Cyanobacteriota bacterium]